MSDLAACAVGARKNPSVDDNAAADTGSERHHHHIVKALAASLPLLTECCHIGVISDLNLHAPQKSRQRGGNVGNAPVKIDRLVDHTVRENRSRNADAKTDNILLIQLLLFHLRLHRGRNVLQNISAVVLGSGRNLPALHQLFLLRIKKAVLDRCTAYINSKCISVRHFLFLSCSCQPAAASPSNRSLSLL